jgi:glycosyltransferase involved in cell wall biosynthesis
VYNKISATKDKNIQYTIFTFRPELRDNSRYDEFISLKISVKCLHNRNIFVVIKKLRQCLFEHNIDIIEANCFRTFFFGSFIEMRKIFVIHQNFYYDYLLGFGVFLGNIMIIIQDRLIKRWDKIICCSKYLVSMIEKKTKHENVCCILNSVYSPSVIPFSSKEENDSVIYIYVGSIDRRKRVKKLCNDFSICSKNGEQLFCIGTGPDFNELENRYKNIKMHGFKRDIGEYLVQADYFISMSVSEGLPLAVIEALACKLPVILSDIPSHRDIFSLNRNIGVLITNGLGDALERIRSSNYKAMSDAAYATYLEYFTSTRMADAYIRQYNYLYNGRIYN